MSSFRVFLSHPHRKSLSEYDTNALGSGLNLVFELSDISYCPGIEILQERFPEQVFVRCDREGYQNLSRSMASNVILRIDQELDTGRRVGTGQFLAECADAGALSRLSADVFDGVVIKGCEAKGKNSALSNFVFFQFAMANTDLPVYVRGGVGKHGLVGIYCGGGAGVVLDEQTYLFNDSPLSSKEREDLLAFSRDNVVCLMKNGFSYRFCASIKSEVKKSLEECCYDMERSVKDFEEIFRRHESESIRDALDGKSIFPIDAGAFYAHHFMREYADTIGFASKTEEYINSVRQSLSEEKPFARSSRFCMRHGIEYPFFQGPMANITESSEFAEEVINAGGMPFLAVGTLPEKMTGKMIRSYKKRNKEKPMGLGLMGMLDETDDEYTDVARIVDEAPDYVIVGGAPIEKLVALEKAGISVYTHTPSYELFSYAVGHSINNLILEGNEAGGHVGKYSSLILWQDVLYGIEQSGYNNLPLNVVFAGGVSSRTGVEMLSGMVASFRNTGIDFGIQVGTALLATVEIVECGALDAGYRERILEGKETTVVFERSGRPQRMLPGPKTDSIHRWENEGLKQGRSTKAMKDEFEKEINRGALRLAARNEVFNPASLTNKKAKSFVPNEDAELRDQQSGFLCGQNICMIDKPIRLREFMAELFDESCRNLDRRVIEECTFSFCGLTERGFSEKIAVVGVGCRFPEARNTKEFWANILSSRSSIREVPPERWDPRLYWDPDRSTPNKTYSKIGSFVDDSDFNPLDFGIMPKTARDIPTVQKIALLAAQEAIVNSAFNDKVYDPDRVGVFMGTSIAAGLINELSIQVDKDFLLDKLDGLPSVKNLKRQDAETIKREFAEAITLPDRQVNEDTNPGILSNIVAARIAHEFDFHGPNYTADAACASSLAALLNACRALQAQQVDVALTGGSDISNDALTYITFAKIGAISANMSCPFDERANGFVMAEGAGVLILKRLKDAERDGDVIYGVIRGIGSSSDGSAKGITAPNKEGQMKALKRAYIDSGITPDTIGLYEAHGTSTPVGDATEFSAISDFYRGYTTTKNIIPLGSVKSQIGHTKAAAGIAGLIKCVLSLFYRVLPATINVETVNQKLGIENSPFYLNTSVRNWTKGEFPRRAACSSMGFGGTNFHIVIEEYDPFHGYEYSNEVCDAGLLAVSESDQTSADDLKAEIERRAEIKQFSINSLRSWSVTAGNTMVSYRDKSDLLDRLNRMPTLPKRAEGKICFLFPGQGFQFTGMGLDLPLLFPELTSYIEAADSITGELLGTPISEIIRDTDRSPLLKETRFCQPAVLLVSFLCYRTAQMLGLRAGMGIGHSLGEITALACSGAFDFEEAVKLVIMRAEAINKGASEDRGLMAAIMADTDTVADVLKQVDEYVVVANYNSKTQVVISGSSEGVRKAIDLFSQSGIQAVPLNVSHAFHSKLILPGKDDFRANLDSFTFDKMNFPVLSNVAARLYEDDVIATKDTLAQQLVSPVEFTSQITKAYEMGFRTFVTIGPGRILSKLVAGIIDEPVTCLDMLPSERSVIYDFVAEAMNRGMDIDLRHVIRALKQWKREKIDIARITPAPKAVWNENKISTKKHRGNTRMVKTGVSKQGGRSMNTGISANLSGIEQYILSLGDPILNNLLHSPDFRAFVNREEMAIKMLLKQALLEMFQYESGAFTRSNSLPDLPAFEPQNIVYNSPGPQNQYIMSEQPSDEPYSVEFFKQELDASAPGEEVMLETGGSDKSQRVNRMSERERGLEGTIDVQGVLLEIIKEKTGYTEEMIGADAEFETELRIDSIKQTEILGQLSEKLNIPRERAFEVRPNTMTLNTILESVNKVLSAVNK